MANIALKADKISKFFNYPDKLQVLQDINLTVYEKEFVAIIGKSGCGKSTLLYILSTMDTEYEGTLQLNGNVVTGKNEAFLAGFRNEHIGFVFQYHFLLPEFSVLENVMIPALRRGVKKRSIIKEEAIHLLTQLDMQKEINKLASRLSGGQQQRIAIARALINHPAIILADEPTGNLDSYNSSVIFDIFHSLSQQGNTVIVVTHDQDFASGAQRIIKLKDGRIENDEVASAQAISI